MRSDRELAIPASEYELLSRMDVAASRGAAVKVRAGQVVRITLPDGPQIVDLNCWNAKDPREHFWSGRTRILEGVHLSVGNRLWSIHPWMRPMMTILTDTVEHRPSPGGGIGHDCLYARCTDKLWEMLTGKKNHQNCQDNLAQAISSFGLTPFHVHDALNLFMKTGIDPQNGRLFFVKSDAKKGDYVDLSAEMDLIVACSSCPGGAGDLQRPIVHRVGIDVYRPGTPEKRRRKRNG